MEGAHRDFRECKMSTVIIFRNELLPISETFIEAQVRALKSFQPRYVGLVHASRSLPLPANTIFLCGRSSRFSRVLAATYKSVAYPRRAYPQVREVGARLLHAHFALDGATALPLLSYLKIPLLVTLHGYDVTTSDATFRKTIGGRLYLARRERLWNRASLFLCVSQFIRKKAIEAGFPEEKLLVHYIGVDRCLFDYVPNQAHRKSVLFVGRLVEKKGCSYLLEAMAGVQKRHPDAELIVVGTGPQASSLAEQAKRLSLHCRFLDVQPQSAIHRLLQSARVFCVPSVTAATGDSEGLGMVFAEAQAMGVPVVSFQHGGIPEVVRHGETGLLAPERDTAALGQYIERLITDDQLWEQYSRAGVAWVQRQFDLEEQTRKLEETYEMVSERSGRSQ
jgi:colanic acid/amylovoran biosynthesis glycosyltransferase